VIAARIDAPASVAPFALFQVGVQVQGPPSHPIEVEFETDADGVRQQYIRRTATNPGGEVVVYFDINAGRTGTVLLVAHVRFDTGQQVTAKRDVAVF